MIYSIIIASTLLTTSLPFEEHKAEVIKIENTDWYRIKKIRFSGHTYIHIKNMWSTADFKYMHDPDCPCVIEAVRKVLEKIEEKKQ